MGNCWSKRVMVMGNCLNMMVMVPGLCLSKRAKVVLFLRVDKERF